MKGKFSYLSPEVATGQAVDARADIFALGVCLWEMLAGRRLFLGDTDYETVQAVSNAEVPSLVGDHPEVDPLFEALLLKALAQGSGRPIPNGARVWRCAGELSVSPPDEGDVVRHRQPRQSGARTPEVGPATADDDRRHDSRGARPFHVA